MNAKAKWIAILAFSICSDGYGKVYALCSSKTTCGNRLCEHSFAKFTNSQSIKGGSFRSNPINSSVVLSSAKPSSSDLSSGHKQTIAKSERRKPDDSLQSNDSTLPELFSVDVRYDRRSLLTFDATSGRYLDVAQTELGNHTKSREAVTIFQKWSQFLHSAFVPEGVSHSYYRFMRWRILQRFANANVHVIGTQSLLMGLRGMQQGNVVGAAASAAKGGGIALGAAAATNWVLKDTLGKLVRMAWASKMGRKFDPDAKRWRFRASLIYALGNGLEVSTYLHPQYFLVLAMLANSCKQMSMLTSSATRNALYNSFRRVEVSSSSAGGKVTSSTSPGSRRGSGGVENIGDITAKGEAQIAVVDLLGIASGIFLSRAIGVSVQNVFAVWIILQVAEIFCMYHEMRSIVYKTFNFERMYTVLGNLLMEEESVDESNEQLNNDMTNRKNVSNSPMGQNYKFTGHIPTPIQIAQKEKIFLPPDHLARRAIAFGSPGRTALDPEELDMLINDVFRGEKYFLVVGQDVKNQRGLSARVRQWMRRGGELCGDNREGVNANGHVEIDIDPMEQCHIVLHADANNLDILKSALALCILRKKLVNKMMEECHPSDVKYNNPSTALRSRDCMDVLRESGIEASDIFPQFLRELTKQGWRPPLRSMLGRVSARAEWHIQRK